MMTGKDRMMLNVCDRKEVMSCLANEELREEKGTQAETGQQNKVNILNMDKVFLTHFYSYFFHSSSDLLKRFS